MTDHKRLILHCDLNGTVMGADSTEPGDVTENANMLLSKSYHGKVWNDRWILNCENEYYDSSNDNISYYDYLKQTDKDHYKKRSFSFTHTGMPGESLAPHVHVIAKGFASLLFPSFVKLVRQHNDDDNVTVVFRTFGIDGEDVLNCLYKQHGFDKFSPDNVVRGTFKHSGDSTSLELSVDNSTVTLSDFKPEQLTELVEQYAPRHFLIREDYDYWNNNRRDAKYGKVMCGDDRTIQIFFDDNDCVYTTNPETRFAHFVKVNSLFALQDEDFFINIVSTRSVLGSMR